MRLIFFTVLVLTGACSRTPEPQAASQRFPVGIYGVDKPEYVKAACDCGFDSIHTYSADPALLEQLAAEAGRKGARLLFYPDELRKASAKRTRGWPVDAWYLMDEPDVVKAKPEALEDLAQRTRDWDPHRPRAFVVGQGSAARLFGGIADILMLDWYPVPHLSLESVADQLDEARRHVPEGKPVWMVVQAMTWEDYPQRDRAKPRIGRFPDYDEMRFMSYLSVLHGAQGLFYFTMKRPAGQSLLDFPELWQAVCRIGREMRAMRPIWEQGELRPLPFPADPYGPEVRVWRHRGRDYAVLLNRRSSSYLRVPEPMLDRRWRPLFEFRREPRELLKEKNGGWYLRPYQVLALEKR